MALSHGTPINLLTSPNATSVHSTQSPASLQNVRLQPSTRLDAFITHTEKLRESFNKMESSLVYFVKSSGGLPDTRLVAKLPQSSHSNFTSKEEAMKVLKANYKLINESCDFLRLNAEEACFSSFAKKSIHKNFKDIVNNSKNSGQQNVKLKDLIIKEIERLDDENEKFERQGHGDVQDAEFGTEENQNVEENSDSKMDIEIDDIDDLDNSDDDIDLSGDDLSQNLKPSPQSNISQI